MVREAFPRSRMVVSPCSRWESRRSEPRTGQDVESGIELEEEAYYNKEAEVGTIKNMESNNGPLRRRMPNDKRSAQGNGYEGMARRYRRALWRTVETMNQWWYILANIAL
jgi:hypothetical protein